MVEVAIVADDLTGAADCAAAVGAAGHRPVVLLEPGAGALAAGSGYDVIALSADSRDASAAAAEEAVQIALQEAAASRPRIWFKKIDSTLRGHLALELQLVRAALAPELTLLCPAFPATGRALRAGHAHVHGEPLERTELWRRSGRGLPHLPTMLAGAGVTATVFGAPSALLAEHLQAAPQGTVLVIDAESDADLAAIARAGAACGRSVLWVGSAGLAHALAAVLRPSPPADPAGAPAGAPAGGPVLVVAGSAAAQTRRQLAELERATGARTALLKITELLAGDTVSSRTAVDSVAEALSRGRDAALAIEPLDTQALLPAYAGRLAERLGALVGALSGRFDGLVLTGGDTARAVLHVLGIRGLAVVGSVERGVPVARALPGSLRVVTKAGAFGDDQSLSRAVRALRAQALPTSERIASR